MHEPGLIAREIVCEDGTRFEKEFRRLSEAQAGCMRAAQVLVVGKQMAKSTNWPMDGQALAFNCWVDS